MDSKTLFLVLGMHRSGTSAVTRALKTLAIDIGQHHLARRDNPRGFFENPDVVDLNTALLAKMGAEWDTVTRLPGESFRTLLESDLFAKASRLLDALPKDRNTAIKDPRLSRLLPFWRPLLQHKGTTTACIIVVRHPSAVAASLSVRDRMPEEQSQALWILYTAEAILFSAGLPRILLSYDALMDNPKQELLRLAHAFTLPLIQDELRLFQESFLDQSLRHHKEKPAKQCAALRLYSALAPLTHAPDAHGLLSPRIERELCAALAQATAQ